MEQTRTVAGTFRLCGLTALALLGGAVSLPAAAAPQASLTVVCGIASVCNSTSTDWTLAKTGAFDGETNTVTWTVSATKGTESDRMLEFEGTLTVTNTGTANATIGNILANLQRKVGKNWVTASSDVANATQGDAATTAKICSPASSENKSSFTENAASGALEFTDANSNTVFSLVPQVQIAPGQTVVLNYSASFDADVLAALGKPVNAGNSVRIEVIVSFGNAGGRGGSGSSCQKVDVNGSGALNADEAWVRSVPCRTTVTVPALERSNASVILSDFESAISATGTVTWSGFATTVGDGTGSETLTDSATRTVSLTVDRGTDGGTIKNCANLDADPAPHCNAPVDLEKCNTQVIPPPDVPPPPPTDPGPFCTYTQGGWGAPVHGNNPAAILAAGFAAQYPAGVEVGTPGVAGYSMKFTSAAAVGAFLPQGGPHAALTADLLNPTDSSAGVFGGQVLALQLNVSFDPAFGALVIQGTGTGYDGMTVSAVLALANAALGGAPLADIDGLNTLADQLNNSWDNCSPDSFGVVNLAPPAAP